jgi:filamentous hemagglutinin
VNFVRNTTADTASMISTNAGRVSAATAAAARIPSPYSTALEGVSFSATAIGMTADAVTQLAKPDVGQYWVASGIGIAANAAAEKYPLFGPAINEIANTISNSDASKGSQSFISDYWKRIAENFTGTGGAREKN